MAGLEGMTLGHYLILAKIGQGGMAEVYLAQDTRTESRIALKVVSGSHSEYIERFRREVTAISLLRHPNILPAFEYGEEGPWHYLTMPYIPYGTLRERLGREHLSLEESGEMLDQIASALQFAHDHGIIHRDLKPSNILLRDDHHAYLADFGLAKPLDNDGNITQTGALLGTPEYMAPELAEGPATTSSDIYALGVLLYQMVTGRVPFSGETPIVVYMKQLRQAPTPPSQINESISPVIERVILYALGKDPAHRFQRAEDLASAFRHALETGTAINEMPSLSELQIPESESQATYAGQAYALEPQLEELQPVLLQQEEQIVLPSMPRLESFDAPNAGSGVQTSYAIVEPIANPQTPRGLARAAFNATADPLTPVPSTRRRLRRRPRGTRRRGTSRVLIVVLILLLLLSVVAIMFSFAFFANSAHQTPPGPGYRPQITQVASFVPNRIRL